MMNKNKTFSLFIFALILTTALTGCGAHSTAAPSLTPSITVTLSPTLAGTVTPSATPYPPGVIPPWSGFPSPQFTPITPIPSPVSGLSIPSEARVLLIAGMDRPAPYSGLTDAITLVIFHPRLARASVISIPPDLFAYIPGYTMQRLYTAYPMGGIQQLESAILYNTGLKPDNYVILDLSLITRLIDDIGGINVFVTDDVIKYCPGIPQGVVLMDGQKALCYMRLRLGNDEYSRNRRQQEVIQTIFLRMVENGNLVRLPELYEKYQGSLQTNISGREIFDAIPLMLKLGDAGRIGFFHPGEKEISTWVIPQRPPAQVFLPDPGGWAAMMQQAVDFITLSEPFTDRIATLAYELTASPSPTNTATVTFTPTSTRTPTPTKTFTPTRTFTVTISFTPSKTFTLTITRTPTITLTRTVTPTFTISPTTTPSPTMTQAPTGTITPTDTLTPTPTITTTQTGTSTSTVTPTP